MAVGITKENSWSSSYILLFASFGGNLDRDLGYFDANKQIVLFRLFPEFTKNFFIKASTVSPSVSNSSAARIASRADIQFSAFGNKCFGARNICSQFVWSNQSLQFILNVQKKMNTFIGNRGFLLLIQKALCMINTNSFTATLLPDKVESKMRYVEQRPLRHNVDLKLKITKGNS